MSRTWAELLGDAEDGVREAEERTGFFGRLRDSLSKMSEAQWIRFARSAELRPPMPWWSRGADGQCTPDCPETATFPWTIKINGQAAHSMNANRVSLLMKPGEVEHWTYINGGGGWGNNELETYTDTRENSVLVADAGALDGHALACIELVQRLARELAVAGEFAHRVIHVAVAGAVGQAFLFQRADHAQHLRHIVGGARFVLRALDAQCVGVLVQRVDHAVGQVADGFAVFQRALDDLVVDVGDVADISDTQATGLEPALHHVKGNHRAGMAQVAQVIHRHATHVHAHMARLQGLEVGNGTQERVEDAQAHLGKPNSGRPANRPAHKTGKWKR